MIITRLKRIIRKFIYTFFKKRDQGKIDIALYNKDGIQLGVYTTDNNGKILIHNLEIGSYIIYEIPPLGMRAQLYNVSNDWLFWNNQN